MGYSNGFVASIISKNKPLREFKYGDKRTVKVPFGSEYIIRLKNKSKDPALVDVSVDGTDVLNGSQLVLKAGESIDLERFVDDNSKGKKFKYISLEEGASTGEIDDPYRDENGLIQVKFHKAYYLPSILREPTITTTYPPFCGAVINHDYWIKGGPTLRNGEPVFGSSSVKLDSCVTGAAVNSRGISSDSTQINSCYFSQATPTSDLPQDKGATVEGSDSSQSFSNTNEYFSLGGEPTLVSIYMVGPDYKEESPVIEWGVFIGSNKEPVATFKEKKHAHLFAGNADFGRAIVTVKETV